MLLNKEMIFLRDKFNGKRFLKFILIFIILSIMYLIFLKPYIGMADNGDFQRLIQKVGLDYTYNPWEEDLYSDSFFHYSVNSYKSVDPIDNGWFTPFEFNVSFSKFMADAFSKTGNYDIRFMGLTNLIFYIIGLTLLLYAFSMYSKCIIFFSGLITYFFATDSYIIQYFNSFYSEIGTVLYLIIFFSLCIIFIKKI